MLRSSQIPPMLHRISGNGVFAAMVVTADGELLGTSYQNNSELNSNHRYDFRLLEVGYGSLSTETEIR
jgi:hypothetical protein